MTRKRGSEGGRVSTCRVETKPKQKDKSTEKKTPAFCAHSMRQNAVFIGVLCPASRDVCEHRGG
jgi:hypothetical protein